MHLLNLLWVVPLAYLFIGVFATVLLWPYAKEDPPSEGDEGLLLRMVGVWPAYVGIALGGVLVTMVTWMIRKRM